MTVTDVPVRNTVSDTGFTGVLSLPNVLVEDETHVKVYAGVTELSLGSDYSVTGVLDPNGPVVTILDPSAHRPTTDWTIRFAPPLDQAADLSLGGSFGLAYENAIDALTRRFQSVAERLNRSLTLSVNYTGNPLALPPADPGKSFKWNETGDGLVNTVSDPDSFVADALAAAAEAKGYRNTTKIYRDEVAALADEYVPADGTVTRAKTDGSFGLPEFETRADAEGWVGTSPMPDSIVIRGMSIGGDGGGGVYRRVGIQPAHAAKFQSNGVWYELDLAEASRKEFFDRHKEGFRLVAHRGREFAPENTLAAIDQLPRGTYAIETDYRKTSDGRYVIIHDATVDRTTNGTGAIASMTFAQARALDAGSWYDPAFAGEKLPTIGEYVSASKEKGIRYILLQPYGLGDATDAANVLAEVGEVGGLSSVIFMANDVAQAEIIRGVSASCLLGLFGTTTSNLNANLAAAVRLNVCLMLSAAGSSGYNPALYGPIKASGIIPGTSTLNDAELMRDAASNSDACFSLTDWIQVHKKFDKGITE